MMKPTPTKVPKLASLDGEPALLDQQELSCGCPIAWLLASIRGVIAWRPMFVHRRRCEEGGATCTAV